jgi:hypothetical protein
MGASIKAPRARCRSRPRSPTRRPAQAWLLRARDRALAGELTSRRAARAQGALVGDDGRRRVFVRSGDKVEERLLATGLRAASWSR